MMTKESGVVDTCMEMKRRGNVYFYQWMVQRGECDRPLDQDKEEEEEEEEGFWLVEADSYWHLSNCSVEEILPIYCIHPSVCLPFPFCEPVFHHPCWMSSLSVFQFFLLKFFYSLLGCFFLFSWQKLFVIISCLLFLEWNINNLFRYVNDEK